MSAPHQTTTPTFGGASQGPRTEPLQPVRHHNTRPDTSSPECEAENLVGATGQEGGAVRDEDLVCGLCGHDMEFDTCGYAGTWQMTVTGEQQVYLCHADDHDCYHLWTVYGERPA